MPRSHTNWHQFLADAKAARHRRRGGSTEAHAGRGELVDDVVAWITAYLDRPTEEDEGHPRRNRRGSARRIDFNALFEDGSDPSVWPDEVHEHLATLRDRLHGISARQDGRGRNRHPRWGRRRSARSSNPAGERGPSSRARRLIWLAVTRVALLVITAMVVRGREARSRRRRGFSV